MSSNPTTPDGSEMKSSPPCSAQPDRSPTAAADTPTAPDRDENNNNNNNNNERRDGTQQMHQQRSSPSGAAAQSPPQSSATSSPPSQRHQNNNHNHHHHHRHNNNNHSSNHGSGSPPMTRTTPTGCSGMGGGPSSSSPASSPKSWSEQLASFLSVMGSAKKSSSSAAVTEYYKRQNRIIQRLIEVDHLQVRDQQFEYSPLHDPTSCVVEPHCYDDDGTTNSHQQQGDNESEEEDPYSFFTTGSLLLNIVLFALKLFAVVESGSLTVIASLLDSALDLFSGAIMVCVQYFKTNASLDDYPTGKHHFESIGTLVFSCCMCISATKLIETTSTALADIGSLDLNIDTVTIIVMVVIVVSKLIAFLVCRGVDSLLVEALSQDHRNDVFSNLFGLCGLFLAKYVSPYFDPCIALATTLFIMYVWGASALAQINALSGKMADVDYLNQLTMLARNCDKRLVSVDTIRAVTSGDGYVVEIDLVLPPEMPLREAHDIGEKFQTFLEAEKTLEIARAYVHLDYETDHDPKRHK